MAVRFPFAHNKPPVEWEALALKVAGRNVIAPKKESPQEGSWGLWLWPIKDCPGSFYQDQSLCLHKITARQCMIEGAGL